MRRGGAHCAAERLHGRKKGEGEKEQPNRDSLDI